LAISDGIAYFPARTPNDDPVPLDGLEAYYKDETTTRAGENATTLLLLLDVAVIIACLMNIYAGSKWRHYYLIKKPDFSKNIGRSAVNVVEFEEVHSLMSSSTRTMSFAMASKRAISQDEKNPRSIMFFR
jgi:hypothetical protein